MCIVSSHRKEDDTDSMFTSSFFFFCSLYIKICINFYTFSFYNFKSIYSLLILICIRVLRLFLLLLLCPSIIIWNVVVVSFLFCCCCLFCGGGVDDVIVIISYTSIFVKFPFGRPIFKHFTIFTSQTFQGGYRYFRFFFAFLYVCEENEFIYAKMFCVYTRFVKMMQCAPFQSFR